MTNDLFFTYYFLHHIPDLNLLADLSHYVVGQELELPIAQPYAGMIERILNRSGGFHGRVAGTEQLQVEISFPHHRPWVDQFMTWWAYGFRSWLIARGPTTCSPLPARFARNRSPSRVRMAMISPIAGKRRR